MHKPNDAVFGEKSTGEDNWKIALGVDQKGSF